MPEFKPSEARDPTPDLNGVGAYTRREDADIQLRMYLYFAADAAVPDRLPKIFPTEPGSRLFEQLEQSEPYQKYEEYAHLSVIRQDPNALRMQQVHVQVIRQYWAEKLIEFAKEKESGSGIELTYIADDTEEDFAADLVGFCDEILREIEQLGQTLQQHGVAGQSGTREHCAGTIFVDGDIEGIPVANLVIDVPTEDEDVNIGILQHNTVADRIGRNLEHLTALCDWLVENLAALIRQAHRLRIDTAEVESLRKYLQELPQLKIDPESSDQLLSTFIIGRVGAVAIPDHLIEIQHNWSKAALPLNHPRDGNIRNRDFANAKKAFEALQGIDLPVLGKTEVCAVLRRQLAGMIAARRSPTPGRPAGRTVAGQRKPAGTTEAGAERPEQRKGGHRTQPAARPQRERGSTEEQTSRRAGTRDSGGHAIAPTMPSSLTVTRGSSSSPQLHTLMFWNPAQRLGDEQWQSSQCRWQDAEVSFIWTSHRPGSRLIKRVGLGGMVVAMRVPVKISFKYGARDGNGNPALAENSFGSGTMHVKDLRISVGEDLTAKDPSYTFSFELSEIRPEAPVTGTDFCALTMSYSIQPKAKDSKPEPAKGTIKVSGNGTISVTGDKMREHLNAGKSSNVDIN